MKNQGQSNQTSMANDRDKIMPKKVAITGGIGSGKSYICQFLQERGIKVFDCDSSAKRLMATSTTLQQALTRLIGQQVYVDGVLQKGILAQYLLQSDNHKMALNNVIHPAVADDFRTSGCHWLESAIFFDSGFCHRVEINYVICVTAYLSVRLQRVMQRDNISHERAMEWINRQMPQEEMVRLSDFEIVNDGEQDIVQQIDKILQTIINY